MLSRAACLPRVCPSCRAGFVQARATLRAAPAALQQERWIRHAGDPVVQSKERIEALISGKTLDAKSNKPQKKSANERGPYGKKWGRRGKVRPWKTKKKEKKTRAKAAEDDLPDWGSFSPSKVARREPDKENKVIEPVVEMPAEQLVPEDQDLEPPTPAQTPEEIPVQQSLEKQTPNEMPGKAMKKEFARMARPRVFKDELVQTRNLGIAALGEPLDALVVKNPNKMKRTGRPVRMLDELHQAEADLDWHNLLPKCEEPDELMDEAIKNIEELRPQDTTVLRITDFDDLANRLVSDFTSNQLSSYFHRQLPTLAEAGEEVLRYDWALEQTSWEPSQPDHWGKLTMKQRYAVLILKKIWQISVQEQVEGLGKMQLWLPADVFNLISRPSSQVLRSLATEYLYRSDNERLETSADEHRLDIYARKSIVPVVLARLDEVVATLTSQRVSSSRIQAQDLKPAILQELARITNTLIQHDEENEELNVSWLASSDRPRFAAAKRDSPSQTETPAHVVLRLLMRRAARDQQTTIEVVAPPGEGSIRDHTRFITHQRERRSMSWREKLESWSRCASPIAKASATDVRPTTAISLPESATRFAQPGTRSTLTATFGHVLHSKPAWKKGSIAAASPRILSPVVPHPAALTCVARDGAAAVAQSISIQLTFAPITPARTRAAVPEIHLRLPVELDADLSALSLPPQQHSSTALFGVVPRHLHDVLLPGESVDVRLSRHDHLPLDAGQQQALHEFLAACDFNLPEGSLRTPSQTRFAIPASWTTLTGRSRSAKTVAMPYRFMGLEVHQIVEVPWRGHVLRYNSIEAGLHGGQRQELSLQANEDGEDFLRAVADLAVGRDFSWHDGHKMMRGEPDTAPHLVVGDAAEHPLQPAMAEGEETRDDSSSPPSTVVGDVDASKPELDHAEGIENHQ